MTSCDFRTTRHGKWVLAGEHSVLRGHPALIFPIHSKTLQLQYWQTDQKLHANFSGDYHNELHRAFWSVVEYGLQLLDHNLSDITGRFTVINNIPTGVGLGASAALCSALSDWFIWHGLTDKDQHYHFAKELEHLCHGQSSGVDIAGASAKQGVLFAKDKQQALEQTWQPHWYLSYCDQISMTAHCVKKVQDLWGKNPEHGQRIDENMTNCVHNARKALKKTAEHGLTQLAAAINQAHVCFAQWGLVTGKLEHHINELLAAGALAAKPTGSGDGGFVVSLWKSEPQMADSEFIEL